MSAEENGLREAQVNNLLGSWFTAADAYGPTFRAEATLVVLRSLRGQPKFARLSLGLAQQVKGSIANLASDEDRATLLHLLADAATLCGETDLASVSEARAAEIDARLDAEYEARTPPFDVEVIAGRRNAPERQAVLLELFTGATCPPCVAPDVAFDSIDFSFQPSELVLMQYHLPIHGPDPLTNPDAQERWEYYTSTGVPTAFFNGERNPTGGGVLEMAQARYNEFRWWVEQRLGRKLAVDLRAAVERSGNLLAVRVDAAVVAASEPGAEAADKGGDADKAPKLRLRLALTENVIRYNGGNGIRLNHHVARHFPGGVKGKEFADGQSELDLTVDLDEVRRGLNEYAKSRRRLHALVSSGPIPKLELKQLSLVAFVQDDTTKRVLHTVQVAVPDQPVNVDEQERQPQRGRPEK